MKILHVIPSVDPKGGGPIEGVYQLSRAYQKELVDVTICCLDSPDDECVLHSNIKVVALGPSRWGYAYSAKLVPWLKLHRHDYDVVIVNGLWQYTGFAVWRALSGTNTPYYVFTHGMLDPWFKVTYPLKHLKKWLYWPWADYRVLRDARRVIFTCEDERLLARQSFWLYKVNEVVTNYGVSSPPTNEGELTNKFFEMNPLLRGKRIALFLSRIHVKKGCDLLIEAFADAAKLDDRLHLVMAGPDQTGWVSELKVLVERLGISNRISWLGMLQGDMKWGAFYSAEVFCLPSHQENFGIVVAEALACGKPVLISNKVNIWREIVEDGAGLVADDNLLATKEMLNRWVSMSNNEFASMQKKCIPCFEQRFHVNIAAEKLLHILHTS